MVDPEQGDEEPRSSTEDQAEASRTTTASRRSRSRTAGAASAETEQPTNRSVGDRINDRLGQARPACTDLAGPGIRRCGKVPALGARAPLFTTTSCSRLSRSSWHQNNRLGVRTLDIKGSKTTSQLGNAVRLTRMKLSRSNPPAVMSLHIIGKTVDDAAHFTRHCLPRHPRADQPTSRPAASRSYN